jgi:solute carrier family 35 protein F5
MRILVPEEGKLSFQLLFGYIGLFNGLSLLPVLLILIRAAPKVFAGFSLAALGLIMANGFADNVLSDYFWARAIVLTSPTVATVGLSLTIPLAFLSDLLLGHFHGGVWEVFGALAVFVGFVLVSWQAAEGEAMQGGAEEEGSAEASPMNGGGEAGKGPPATTAREPDPRFTEL